MTREEQAQLIEKLVTELAKSRTCENCKHMEQMSENTQWCYRLEQYNMKYCSEFERKEDD